ncbi:hypothetical protein IID20_00845 [Patescibacteria group bacterium]|nr:hypothetical protein [Patescibacteria group bacterium]
MIYTKRKIIIGIVILAVIIVVTISLLFRERIEVSPKIEPAAQIPQILLPEDKKNPLLEHNLDKSLEAIEALEELGVK